MRTAVSLAGAIVFGILTAAPADAAPLRIDRLVVFGDSLSDIGNDYALTDGAVPPDILYYQGRFSDGPVWVDYLAERWNIDLRPSETVADPATGSVNFAYGGTSTGAGNLTPHGFFVPGVAAQVESYRTALAADGQPPDEQTLFVIWAGANDYLLGLTDDPTEPTGNLRVAIERLYDAGARNFLMPNIPDLSDTPITGGNPAARIVTEQHNRLLEQALTDLDQTLPDASLVRLDIAALVEEWLGNPAAYGLTSGVEAGPAAGCLLPPFICEPVEATGTPFFWDEQHPSTAVHALIAQAALRALEGTDPIEVPEPAPILLIAGGLIGLGLLMRRRGRSFNPPASAA